MNYLVTGSAGFIGWNVADKLLRRGNRVVGIDNMNDYYDPRLKEWRLSQLKSSNNFEFRKLDITDYDALTDLFREYRFDGVLNLAARAGVRASVEDPWVYYEANTHGTLNILECCRRNGVNKIILASTSSVYGNCETPFQVEANTDRVLSPYAASKKGAEALCHSYHYLYGLNINIPRYFSVYGPAGRPDMAYFKFMVAIDRGEAINIYGDGRQARDFTYVDDVAEATVKALDLSGFNVFNVGDDNPVELMKIVNIIEDFLGKKGNYNYLDRHPADNLITWADISKTRQLLNWSPEISIEKGLKRVLNWYVEHKDWVQKLNIEI